MRTANGESCRDKLLRFDHVLSGELKIGEGIAIQFDALFDTLGPSPEIRACRIVVHIFGSEDFIRHGEFSVISEFHENPQQQSLIPRGHGLPPWPRTVAQAIIGGSPLGPDSPECFDLKRRSAPNFALQAECGRTEPVLTKDSNALLTIVGHLISGPLLLLDYYFGWGDNIP